MCGIVYMNNFDTNQTASNRVLKQFKRQIHRGTTSFGFALPDKHVNNWKVKYDDIARSLRRTINPEILFHHRLSTSTADRVTACHPFSTKDWFETEFVGVHNGMLSNEHALYEADKEFFGSNFRYVSDNGKDFNDSEAYVFDLAAYFSGVKPAVQMTGYGAFIVVEYDKETHERIRLHFGTTRNTSSPLRVHLTDNHLDVTSEGKGWLIEDDTHYIFDYSTKELSERPLARQPLVTKYDAYQDSRYGYDYDGFGSYSANNTCATNQVKPKTIGEQMREPSLTSWERDLLMEDMELYGPDDYVIAELNRLYPERYHYGWSSYPDGCCEACDGGDNFIDTPVIRQAPAHDTTAKERLKTSIEALVVQRVLEKQAA